MFLLRALPDYKLTRGGDCASPLPSNFLQQWTQDTVDLTHGAEFLNLRTPGIWG